MRKSLLLLLIIAFGSTVFAQNTQFGLYALNRSINPREAALSGKAFSILDGDIQLAQTNPALLSYTQKGSLLFNYQSYYADAKFVSVAGTFGIKQLEQYKFSAGLNYFSYGKFNETDNLGNDLGTFSVNDLVFKLGAARELSMRFSLGTQLKFISSKLYDQNAIGVAVDVAGNYHSVDSLFSAALLISNVGFFADRYASETLRLPFDAAISLSKKLKNAPFRFVFTYDNLTRFKLTPFDDNQVEEDPFTGEVTPVEEPSFANKFFKHVYIGTELVLSKNFHIRLGYNFRKRDELKLEDKPKTVGLSYGLSLRISKFQLNYGRAINHISGPSHFLGVTTSISQFSKNKGLAKD